MALLDSPKTLERTVSKLLARSWVDESFARRFFSEPAAILQEAGINVGEFADVKVVQNLTGELTLQLTSADGGAVSYEIPLPAKPADLTDELLNKFMGDGLVPGLCQASRASTG